MLTIYFKDGSLTTYKECEYTDYEYLRSVFVVIKVTKWVEYTIWMKLSA